MFLKIVGEFVCKHKYYLATMFVVAVLGSCGDVVQQTPPKAPGSVVEAPGGVAIGHDNAGGPITIEPPITVGTQRPDPEQPTRIDPSDLETIFAREEKLRGLPKGDSVLHAPITMKVTEKRKVDLNVGINVPLEVLREQIPSTDQTLEGSPRVSASMAATLTGAGFKIEAITPEEQPIAGGYPTVWSWYIEAKDPGDQVLEARLYAIVGTDRLRVASYTQKITVNVIELSWGEWLQALSHEIDAVKAIAMTVGGVVAAGLGWFGISLSRRKKKSPPKRKPKPATASAPAD
jgi:hypothetical protein